MSQVCPVPGTETDEKVRYDHVEFPRTDVDELKYIAYGVVASILVTLGLVGNLINLAVLTRPNLKGVTFVYLTWLAAADLSSLLVSVSSIIKLYGVQSRSYSSAFYFAHLEPPLVNAFMAASVYLVVALTVDRYFSVCLPSKFKQVHNPRRAKTIVAVAYVTAFVIYIPVAFQKSATLVGEDYLACEVTSVVRNHGFRAYLLIKEVLVRIGPVILVTVLNVAIIVSFRRTLRKRLRLLTPSQRGPDARVSLGEERRLLVLLAGVVVLFVLCMTPAAVLTLLNNDERETDFRFQVFRAVANCLELLNNSLNFFVYCLCSSEIRITFVSLALRPFRYVSMELSRSPSVAAERTDWYATWATEAKAPKIPLRENPVIRDDGQCISVFPPEVGKTASDRSDRPP